MEIHLKPDLEQFLREKVESGKYNSLEEAINEGIKLLMNQELIYQERFSELQQEITIGVEAAHRGEFIDGDVVFERLRQKLELRRHSTSIACEICC
jgi:antitoxin ParD1/3/4